MIVKFDVIIDEYGNVKLMDIVENLYYEFNKEIMCFVKVSKFILFYKEDEVVKVCFIWFVVIEV